MPLPGWAFGAGELVVVAAGEGLERNQGRVVLEKNGRPAGRFDVGLGRTARLAFPAEAGTVEPVIQLDPAAGAPLVVDLGEGGGASARGGQVWAGGDSAAFAAAIAKVDRDQGQAHRAGFRHRWWRESASEASERPAVGRHERVVAAVVGQSRRAGDALGDRAGEASAGVDFTPGGDGRDRGEQQQSDQGDEARLLDACRSTLGSSFAMHGGDARESGRAGDAQGVATLPRSALLLFICGMEGSPFNLFGDPDEFRARMEELSEQMQSSQRVAWADNAIKLAVEMTVASIGQLDLTGDPDQQAMQVRDAIRVLFPESVTLVREAREGLS
jgi:hypothetical protein